MDSILQSIRSLPAVNSHALAQPKHANGKMSICCFARSAFSLQSAQGKILDARFTVVSIHDFKFLKHH